MNNLCLEAEKKFSKILKIVKKPQNSFFLLVLFASVFPVCGFVSVYPQELIKIEIGTILLLWSVSPFIGILLSIALTPLAAVVYNKFEKKVNRARFKANDI